MIVKLMDTRTS